MESRNFKQAFKIDFIVSYWYLFFTFILVFTTSCGSENKSVSGQNCIDDEFYVISSCILSVKNYGGEGLFGGYQNLYRITFENLKSDSIGIFDCGGQYLYVILNKSGKNTLIDSIFLDAYPLVLPPYGKDTIKVGFATNIDNKLIDWQDTWLQYKRDKSKCEIMAKHPPSYYIEELAIRCWCQNKAGI